MCLSNVVELTQGKPKPIAASVQDVTVRGDTLTFIDILGRETVFEGKIEHIDLVKNIISVKKQ